MAQSDNKGIDFVLLGKYFSGEANAEEVIALEDWLADAAHRKKFEELYLWWRQMHPSDDYRLPDPARTRMLLDMMLEAQSQKTAGLRLKRLGFYAIILALIILAIFLVLRKHHP